MAQPAQQQKTGQKIVQQQQQETTTHVTTKPVPKAATVTTVVPSVVPGRPDYVTKKAVSQVLVSLSQGLVTSGMPSITPVVTKVIRRILLQLRWCPPPLYVKRMMPGYWKLTILRKTRG